MATYDILNLDELTDLLASLYGMLFPTQNVARGSDNWKRIRSLAAGLADTHAHIFSVFKGVMPDVSGDDGVIAWARALDIARKGATGSSGVNVLRLVNTTAALVPYVIGTTLRHSSQLRFQINESGNVPANGFIDVDVLAISTGEATNLPAGQTLTFETPVAGIAPVAELQLALTNGSDEESINSLRARVLAKIRDRGRGGAKADWLYWATAVTGIEEVYALKHRNGFGSVDVVAFKRGQGTARFLNSTERATLLAALDIARPWTTAVRVLECIADAQAVKLTVTPKSGETFARDWDDTTPLVVNTYVDATRTLTFTTDRPADMRAGDRICWDAAVGELVQIESLVSTNAVVLKKAVGAIAGATVIYSGGGLTAPTQDAIRDMAYGFLDDDGVYQWGLGPAKGVTEGDWDDSLRDTRIQSSAGQVDGLLFATIVSPVGSYTPTDYQFPDDTQIKVVTLDRVFVRYA